MPALDHLRPRRAEAEDEAAARHQVERRRGHRRVRRRAAGDLHDRRADLDRRRRRGEPREHGDGVGAPRLGRPHRVVAERLGGLDERHELRRIRARRCIAQVDAELHKAILCRYRQPAVAHPELQDEQAYVDNAYEALDKMRSTLERTGDSMATEFAAIAMEAWAKRRVADVPGRRPRPLLRAADARRRAAAALRRPPLGARRPARDARRQLAGAGGEAVLHGDAGRPARASPSGAATAPTAGASSTSPTSRSTAPRSRAHPSRTSCSRSSSAAARGGCATSSRRSSPTSTG